MFVAKSYKNLTKLSEPFEKNGKLYITVQLKSGLPKEVRAYTADEYFKMYPEEKPVRADGKPSKAKPWDKYYKSQKITLGFEKGYITLYRGISANNEEYFHKNATRYCRLWGWYLPSTREPLTDLPKGVTAVTMPAGDIWDEEDWLIEDEVAIMQYVKSILKEEVHELCLN